MKQEIVQRLISTGIKSRETVAYYCMATENLVESIRRKLLVPSLINVEESFEGIRIAIDPFRMPEFIPLISSPEIAEFYGALMRQREYVIENEAFFRTPRPNSLNDLTSEGLEQIKDRIRLISLVNLETMTKSGEDVLDRLRIEAKCMAIGYQFASAGIEDSEAIDDLILSNELFVAYPEQPPQEFFELLKNRPGGLENLKEAQDIWKIAGTRSGVILALNSQVLKLEPYQNVSNWSGSIDLIAPPQGISWDLIEGIELQGQDIEERRLLLPLPVE